MTKSARQRWVGADAEERHVGLRSSMCDTCKSGVNSTGQRKSGAEWFWSSGQEPNRADPCRQ